MQGARYHAGPLYGELDVAGLRRRGGDPDGRLPFAENGKLAELSGDILEFSLILLVDEPETEGLDVLRVHFRDDFLDLDRIRYVWILHDHSRLYNFEMSSTIFLMSMFTGQYMTHRPHPTQAMALKLST